MPEHPCDLPPLEYARPRFQHRIEWVAFVFLGILFKILPLFLLRFFLKALIGLARLIFRKRIEKTIHSIQERIDVSEGEANDILDKSMMNFGWNWVTQIIPQTFVKPGRYHIHGLEHLEKNLEHGRGTVIAAMHMGLWEGVPHAMKGVGIPLAITVAVQHNPIVDKHLNRVRSAGGYHHVLHNRLGIRHTLRYLKGGGILAVLSDVDIGPSGIPLPFLGRPASTAKWPMELSMRTDSDLIVGYTLLDDSGDYHLYLQPLADGEKSTIDLGSRMNDVMSKVIRENPSQWFWMQRRWKTPIEQCRES